MKIGSVLIMVGVLLLVIGYAVPLQILSTQGTTTTSTSLSWDLSGSVTQSSSSINGGNSITLTITVSYYSNSGTGGTRAGTILYWDVNNYDIHSVTINGTGTWSYTYYPSSGSYSWNAKYMSYFNSLPLKIQYSGFGSGSFSVSASAPKITSFTGSPNPSSVGQSVSFSSSINWNGNTGSVTYSVNGNSIGSDYAFNQAGSYVVTLTAVNSIGSTSSTYTQVVQSGISKPSIESISANPNPVDAGSSVQFSSVINWNGNTGTVVYEVNGHSISGTTYTFSSAGNYTITVVATNSAGSSSSSITEVVTSPVSVVTIPTITSFTASPNPVTVGTTTTFTADINWNGNTGTLVYKVNGQTISSNTFVFTENGNYTIEVIATNSAGSASANLTLEVEPTPAGNMQNVGQFALSYNGTNPFYITNSKTYNLHPSIYPYEVTIYYVEDHGQTANLSGITIDVNSISHIIPFTNITTVMGHTAYRITLSLSAGSFVVTGYLNPSNIQVNNGNPIQTTSFTINTEQTIPAIPQTTVNYVVLGLGSFFILFGIVFLIRKW